MKVTRNNHSALCFISSRRIFLKIRLLRQCSYSLWVYNGERCGCEFRLGLCRLLIKDYVKFMNYEDFDVLSAFSEFNRTYPDIPENHLFIVMNH